MYLEERNVSVTITDDPDREERRLELGVPEPAASCHTAVVAGYVVEGHVPIQAMQRLLDDRPDIVGLAVPGMPPDSPGMGGDETTWAAQSVLAISADGSLSPFPY